MKEVLSFIASKMLGVLPAFMLARMFPVRAIASQVEISLPGESPIQVHLNAENPYIDIWFEITNLSHVDLILDRLIIDLWFGQPTLVDAYLRRHRIPARTTNKDIHFRKSLTPGQVSQIQPYLAVQPPAPSISVSLIAYFQSRAGIVETEKRLQRTKV